MSSIAKVPVAVAFGSFRRIATMQLYPVLYICCYNTFINVSSSAEVC